MGVHLKDTMYKSLRIFRGYEIPKKSKLSKVTLDFSVAWNVLLHLHTAQRQWVAVGLVIVGGDISNKEEIAKVKAVGKSKKLKKLLDEL